MLNKLITKILYWLGMRLISEREKKLNQILKLKEDLLVEQTKTLEISKTLEDESLKELIYIDKNNNKWYSLTNYLNVDMQRFVNIQIAERFLQMNITKEHLLELAFAMKNNFDESKWADLGALIGELIARTKFEAERVTYIQYMSLVFLVNDETTHFNNDLYNKKIKMIEEDEDLQRFFLNELQSRFNLFTTNSNKIYDYFQKTDQMKMKLNLIRESSLENPSLM